MEFILTHWKPAWPIVASIAGFLLALFYGVRYKFPDLTRRIGLLESKKRAHPQDISKAIDSFHAVCRFNQVSCQKEVQHHQSQVLKEVDKTLATMYEKINALAITVGKLSVQVELLVQDRNGNGKTH